MARNSQNVRKEFTMTMDRQTVAQTVVALLRSIAPEVAADELEPGRPLRSQVDLDSMDWLNFLVSLHERFGVNIPEADYARLVSLNDVLDYLLSRVG
jgi:acyl carrier protein